MPTSNQDIDHVTSFLQSFPCLWSFRFVRVAYSNMLLIALTYSNALIRVSRNCGKNMLEHVMRTNLLIPTICTYTVPNQKRQVTWSNLPLPVNFSRLWSKSRYKCFETFDGPIRRKNFTNFTDQLKNALKRLQHRVDRGYVPNLSALKILQSTLRAL